MALSQAEATTLGELEAIARQFVDSLRPGMRVGLLGQLGAGKSTFVKYVARALGVTQEVLSPTYLYHQEYAGKLPSGEKITLHHLDLYRLRSAADLSALDLRVEDPQGVVCIEWVDHVPELQRQVDVCIRMSVLNEHRLLRFDWRAT
ncbi:MAG: tRNA (adenosine(37)-N6)-threonylcarbamoyltransferase complex ATPase subunit type 1 TsaE [Patescibacteria group bacterium]